MDNNTEHHRRSIRLKDYDYTLAGYYYVTICVQDKVCLWGKIRHGEMILNEAGNMIDRWCKEIPNKFGEIELDRYIIMPNHFHAIIINTGEKITVGADLCVCQNKVLHACSEISRERMLVGRHAGLPLHRVVNWFKTMTTNEYIRGVKEKGWSAFRRRLWQRNYYEHIIRNQDDYGNIQSYIDTNPKKWEVDSLYSRQETEGDEF